MSDYFTTDELAEFLRVKPRKVYDLVAKEEVPFSRVMGKLLFSKEEVANWIAGKNNSVDNKKYLPDVFLGSHDPLLEYAIKQSGSGIALSFDGSNKGLERFKLNQGIASGLHIYDFTSKKWNITSVEEHLNDKDFVLMEWAKRERGLIFKSTNEPKKSIKDFKGQKLVSRQTGSGADNYLKNLLESENLNLSDFLKTEIVYSEIDAVSLVLSGQADVTLGLASEAEKYKLKFIPVVEERFDLVIDRFSWFENPFQKLFQFSTTIEFIDIASRLKGYNIKDLGMIHFNSK